MKKKFFISLFFFAAAGLFIFAHIVLKQNDNYYQTQQNLNAPIEIPDASVKTIEEAEKIDKPVVALFYVDWCGYCRKFMPVFGKIASQYAKNYTFAAINCDNPAYSQMLKDFHIIGFPSVFVIDKKINHKFILNTAVLSDESLIKEELDSYLKVRKNILK
ncbi:MAG: thioredoxin family protein [Candidatus Avigastranaerophilus sp.]